MIKLDKISTRAPEGLEKKETVTKRKRLAEEIEYYQNLLYGEKKQSLLVVFQGMDSSGKDGTTRKVFQNCSPSGVWAYGFKKPTDIEAGHDFLWRVHKWTPSKGMIQVFNRSHYEDILIQRVHNWIDDDRREKRMEAINAFEQTLEFDNQTKVLKFYLHLSPERQEEKLRERIERPEKNWKHNDGDWEERKYWSQYMEAYEYAINHSKIPWNIVPADQTWYRDYFVAEKVLQTLKEMNPKTPLLTEEQKQAWKA